MGEKQNKKQSIAFFTHDQADFMWLQ